MRPAVRIVAVRLPLLALLLMLIAAGPASAQPLASGEDCLQDFEDLELEDQNFEDQDLPPCPDDEENGSGLGPVLMAWLLGLAMGGAGVGAVLRARPDNDEEDPVDPPPPPRPAADRPAPTVDGLLTSARELAKGIERDAYRIIVERAIENAQEQTDSDQRGARIADGLIQLDRHLFQDQETRHLDRVRQILQRSGFSLVQPNPGDPFDERRHRAVDRAPTEDPALDNTIKEIWSPGYYDNRADRMKEFPTVVIHRLNRQPATGP